jgi:hypothetical protein
LPITLPYVWFSIMITMTWGFAAGPGTAAGALLDGAVAVRGVFGREEVGGDGGGALEIVVGGAGFGAVDDAGSGAEEDED